MTLDTNDTNDTHFCQRNQKKCSKSRLVTTSAIKHFIPKVAYFYPKSGVVLGASIYVKPPPTAILRLAKRLRRLPEQARPFPLTRLPVAFPVAFPKKEGSTEGFKTHLVPSYPRTHG